MKLAITGATGLVGRRLVPHLQDLGYPLLLLTRDRSKAAALFPAQRFPQVAICEYTPNQSGAWQGEVATCDGVVNLAGAPIGEKRWTAAYKQEIIHSRRGGTEKLVEAFAQGGHPPQVWINASAIGYYGTSLTATFTETSDRGQDFLADVCQAWEEAAHKIQDQGSRLVILRLGIVLDPGGGALGKMIPAFKLFSGGPLGTGKQWVSWVHIDDLVRLIATAIADHQWQGIYNATAPQPVTMGELCQTLGQQLHRPSWLPVPEFALTLLLGEGAQLVLDGQKVLPDRPQRQGFTFTYDRLGPAIRQLLT